MKKNETPHTSDKSSIVKEISDGVYINLSRISSDETEFEKAIEDSFKKLDKDALSHESNKESSNSKQNH